MQKQFDFSPLSVLVCAELEFARRLITDMCVSLRFSSVVSKRDYAGAWEAFTTLPIDMIIGDIGSDDGMRLLKSVRNIDTSPNLVIPFIAMSASSSKPSVARARDAGATEFLIMPLSATTLIERIIYVIEHPRVFVRAPNYVGPDRRRKQRDFQGADRRQPASSAAAVPAVPAVQQHEATNKKESVTP